MPSLLVVLSGGSWYSMFTNCGILKSVMEAEQMCSAVSFNCQKLKIPAVNLIREFNTSKENVYTKLEDGNTLSFEKVCYKMTVAEHGNERLNQYQHKI